MATFLTMVPPGKEDLYNKKKKNMYMYENRSICSKIIDEQTLKDIYK